MWNRNKLLITHNNKLYFLHPKNSKLRAGQLAIFTDLASCMAGDNTSDIIFT